MEQAVLHTVNGNDAHWTDLVAGLETTYDVFKYLRATAEEFGFKKFSVVEVPWEEASLSSVMIMNNWDPEFVQAYDELNLARNSPIFLHVRKSVLPLLFDVKEVQAQGPTEQRAAAMRDFESFRQTKGLILPAFAPNGKRGAVTFTGSHLQIAQDDVQSLHVRAIHVFERLSRLRDERGSRRPELSEKERECLSWTAQGKTSGEIADILELTVNSVNHHLTACCKKLDSTNRVSAVATAVRMGLVD